MSTLFFCCCWFCCRPPTAPARYSAYTIYDKDVTRMSTQIRPRFEGDITPVPNEIVVILSNGNSFQAGTLFRWVYMLRGIFNGDTTNNVHPRVYETVPRVSCPVYQNDGGLGRKVAINGCLNTSAMIEKLKVLKATPNTADPTTVDNEGPNNPPGDYVNAPVVQGKYRDAAYWFLQLKHIGCPKYSPKKGIVCQNYTTIRKAFGKKTYTVKLVMKSEITREYSAWSNLYLNVDFDRWTGIETYLQLTRSFESNRGSPVVTKPPVNLIKYSQFTSRSCLKFPLLYFATSFKK